MPPEYNMYYARFTYNCPCLPRTPQAPQFCLSFFCLKVNSADIWAVFGLAEMINQQFMQMAWILSYLIYLL